MILADVNVLVYAAHVGSAQHLEYRQWLRETLSGPEGLALTTATVVGFCRIVTQPSVFSVPSTPAEAVAVVSAWAAARRTRWLEQDATVWPVLADLLSGPSADTGVRGSLVPDALLAATAIAHRAKLATADRGFRRFPGLRLVHPVG